jgi:hypothetical protein
MLDGVAVTLFCLADKFTRGLSMHPSATAASVLPPGHRDLAGAIVEGFLAGRAVIAVISAPGAAYKPVIDAALGALAEQLTRIVRVEETSISRLGPSVSVMDQLSESATDDGAETGKGSDGSADPVAAINRGLEMLRRHSFGERRRLLVVESAHTLSPQALDQLTRLTMAGPPELPTQMLFVGAAIFWHQLQPAVFEETRRRIGVPLLVLPPSTTRGDALTATSISNPQTRDERQKRRTRFSRRGIFAVLVLIGVAFMVCGLLLADRDLRNKLLAQSSALWTALKDRIHAWRSNGP